MIISWWDYYFVVRDYWGCECFNGICRCGLLVWSGWIGKDMKNGRKEVGESGGMGVDFFHFDFCIVNGHANAG